MTASIQNPQVQMLCILAENDEPTLQFPLPDAIFGFHAQQSCEKLFKALIAAHNQVYPFKQDLHKLMEQLRQSCNEVLPELPYEPLELQPFAVKLRYELQGILSIDQRSNIRDMVAILRRHVLFRILSLERECPPVPFLDSASYS